MKDVSFRPKDCDRVTVAVQEIGDSVVVEGTFKTDNPFVVAALDAHPMVERGKAKAEKAEKAADEPGTDEHGEDV